MSFWTRRSEGSAGCLVERNSRQLAGWDRAQSREDWGSYHPICMPRLWRLRECPGRECKRGLRQEPREQRQLGQERERQKAA